MLRCCTIWNRTTKWISTRSINLEKNFVSSGGLSSKKWFKIDADGHDKYEDFSIRFITPLQNKSERRQWEEQWKTWRPRLNKHPANDHQKDSAIWRSVSWISMCLTMFGGNPTMTTQWYHRRKKSMKRLRMWPSAKTIPTIWWSSALIYAQDSLQKLHWWKEGPRSTLTTCSTGIKNKMKHHRVIRFFRRTRMKGKHSKPQNSTTAVFYTPLWNNRLQRLQKVWGSRPNEDNWRRATDFIGRNPGLLTIIWRWRDESYKVPGAVNKRIRWWQNIPLNTVQKAISNKKISSLLCSAGIYKDDLQNYPKHLHCRKNVTLLWQFSIAFGYSAGRPYRFPGKA